MYATWNIDKITELSSKYYCFIEYVYNEYSNTYTVLVKLQNGGVVRFTVFGRHDVDKKYNEIKELLEEHDHLL